MSLQIQRLPRHFAAAAAVALLTAPSAVASTGLRSPDTRDAALAVHGVTAPVDLRSPDTRDASSQIGAGRPALAVDLRSPDTRDVAGGGSPATNSEPVHITVVRPGGFNWSDAGIGAGAGAGLILLVVGTSLLVRLGRTEARPA
jgi:hypothetical protein